MKGVERLLIGLREIVMVFNISNYLECQCCGWLCFVMTHVYICQRFLFLLHKFLLLEFVLGLTGNQFWKVIANQGHVVNPVVLIQF